MKAGSVLDFSLEIILRVGVLNEHQRATGVPLNEYQLEYQLEFRKG